MACDPSITGLERCRAGRSDMVSPGGHDSAHGIPNGVAGGARVVGFADHRDPTAAGGGLGASQADVAPRPPWCSGLPGNMPGGGITRPCCLATARGVVPSCVARHKKDATSLVTLARSGVINSCLATLVPRSEWQDGFMPIAPATAQRRVERLSRRHRRCRQRRSKHDVALLSPLSNANGHMDYTSVQGKTFHCHL